MLREIRRRDIFIAQQFHDKFYRDEFPFPNFYRFASAWTIADEDDRPIIVGGLKSIAESIIITDKEYSPRVRRAALLENLEASIAIGRECGFDQIHCAIQDKVYEKHLKKLAGFRDVKGSFLVRDI